MIDFPNSPTVGQIFTGAGGVSWQWDGTKWVVNPAVSSYVLRGGDTMNGFLTLSGAPTANLHAATKLYVDTAPFLPITGNRARALVSGGNPGSTTSTTGLMAGLGAAGCVITPRVSGVLDVSIWGAITNTGVSTSYANMRYGSGTPPANGAPLTGTQVATNIGCTTTVANQIFPFCINVWVAGLTLNTQYWFDLQQFVVGGAVQLYNTYFKAVEL